jgi:hypothetical protein
MEEVIIKASNQKAFIKSTKEGDKKGEYKYHLVDKNGEKTIWNGQYLYWPKSLLKNQK